MTETLAHYSALENTLLQRGVQALIIDLDDVFFATAAMYHRHMAQAATLLGSQPEHQIQAIRHLRPKIYVDPQIMIASITQVFFDLNLRSVDLLCAAQQCMLDIFTDIPDLLPGADQATAVLSRFTAVNVCAWTHATPSWTEHKLAAYPQLRTAFTHVVHTHVYQPKTLAPVLHTLQVAPEQIIVIGDSIDSDVRTALSAGVPPTNVIRIASSSHVGNDNAIPAGITQTPSLLDALTLLGV